MTTQAERIKPKVLMLATVASMIDLFNMDNIAILESLGYDVHVAANFQSGSVTSRARVDAFRRELIERGIKIYDIPIPRSITRIKDILLSYRSVKGICGENQYKILHCHSPIGGVLARLGARKIRQENGARVIYTAHGFHFYKGAPLKNWLLYYPLEWLCSIWTDVLITINKEDYALAQRKMKARQVEYVPGVGVDLSRFAFRANDRARVREELGVKADEIMLLSVGEINQNKNHKIVVRALARVCSTKVRYFIVGEGAMKEYLFRLASKLGIAAQVHLLGYRKDVARLLCGADIFCFPSKREGLPVSLMEAMASGLPCIASQVRGNTDLIQDRLGGYVISLSDIDGFRAQGCILLGNMLF